jgi:hypothetical protein
MQPQTEADTQMPPTERPRLDGILREMLRGERRRISGGGDPYFVCHDVSLDEMATVKPTTIAELINIKGIKAVKAAQYGAQFLAVIAKRPDVSSTRIYTLDEAIALHNTACLYHKTKPTKSIRWMEKCVESKRQLLGPDHSSTRLSENALNDWRAQLHRTDEFPLQVLADLLPDLIMGDQAIPTFQEGEIDLVLIQL